MATSLFPCCVPLISKNSLSNAFTDDCCSKKSCDNQKNKDPHSENNDTCSPFFSCGSCAGFSFNYTLISLINKTEFTSHNNYYQERTINDVCNKKWQPPKIS